LYGVTQNGGASLDCDSSNQTGCGTVFKITPGGTLTTLHSFDSTGNSPYTALVRGSDGNFYGVTGYGGEGDCIQGCGTVFKIAPDGSFTTLHYFQNTDGSFPIGALIQGTDGNFYGTTSFGGANTGCDYFEGCGTVYKITPGGTLTTLYNFEDTGGYRPSAALVQGSDGNFYGTTAYGGDTTQGCGGAEFGCGTAFEITPSGVLTTLHTFDFADGAYPWGALVQGADGNFYGTTMGGGADVFGSAFKMTATGAITTLHSFCSQPNCLDGSGLEAGLFEATSGKFYGVTETGGTNPNCDAGCGTVFDISVGFSPVVETVPVAGVVGEQVGILGSDLSGATEVNFNGTSAQFTVRAKTLIVAKVPSGATTGTVQVELSGRTLISSNVQFQVLP
jgi:uncharacterized repeat protein (TIGR03803 family)